MSACIAIVHIGDMGSSLSVLLRAYGYRVIANLDERSERTRSLASAAGVEVVHGNAALLEQADYVLSVLWPSKAVETAQAIASAARTTSDVRTKFYVDLNAIAPSAARQVESAFEGTGIDVVDGGILGGPAKLEPLSCPVIALSGEHAQTVAKVLRPAFGEDRVKVIGPKVGAALNKCFQALAVNTLALAAQTDTLDALEAELADSQADLLKRIQRGLPLNMAKAPRWIGEMDEISAAMSEVGLEGGARMLDGAGRTWELVAKTEVGQEPIEEARRRPRDWKSVVEIISKAAAADL